MALEPLGLARLSDKLGTLYLHYQNAYDHQTCGLATYNEFPPIVSLDPSIMWSCKVVWQIKQLFLHLDKTNGHQTQEAADLLWGAFIH